MARNSLATDRTPAEKQRDYRLRVEAGIKTADALVEALIHACDRGRAWKFVDGLPEERQARMEELIKRLEGVGLCPFPPRKEKPPVTEE